MTVAEQMEMVSVGITHVEITQARINLVRTEIGVSGQDIQQR